MVRPFAVLRANTRWGIALSGVAWWFTATVPPLPAKHHWVALSLLPWLLWPIPLYPIVRAAIWPGVVAATLLFRRELGGVALFTQLFLAAAYYFFLLEEKRVALVDNTSLSTSPLPMVFTPELFLLQGVLSLVLVTQLARSTDTALFALLLTSASAAQFAWWRQSSTLRLSVGRRYGGVAFALLLSFCALLGSRLNLPPLFWGALFAMGAFTLLGPYALKSTARNAPPLGGDHR